MERGAFAFLHSLNLWRWRDIKQRSSLSAKALSHLSSIDKKATNLEALQNIKTDIKSMKAGIDDMNLKGVRLR